ncbi:ABC-2 family transporter protein [Nocardioides mesophilus]|uniref:ABC-2 family transporter protein n=2 Tax=Nocardioides mesophilus TaxID=433659 RepID=A0A7G9RHX2_9ACTN|nr:ABC-2 family transporter protein [Nocardioides mesophilus]
MWIRVSLTYRTSFAMLTLGQLLVTGLDFLGIVVMFSAVDALGGFSLPEVAFLYGGAGVCLGLADLLLGNIERLGQKIRLGTFDAMMVRPVPLYAQMCSDEFALRRLGRITQAAVVLAWSILTLDLDWTPAKVLAVPYLVVFGTAIFVAFFTLGAAFQFWTTDGSEAANAFTYGGNTLAQYPLTIYPLEAVKALTFLVPLAFVNWYPSLFVLGRADPLGLPRAMQFAAPVAALVLAAVAAVAWRGGVRRYRSTGS